MMKQHITEEMEIHEEWYKEARGMTLDKLPDFLNHLMNDYEHDYGTICHALSAGSLATAWAMNRHEEGGITGFQASAVMWRFVRNWNYFGNKTGLKIVDYDDFLYPQYANKHDKIINIDTWSAIKKEAAAKIKEADDKHKKYMGMLKLYEIDMAIFLEKHPDYTSNPEKYDHIFGGTEAEWEEENEKIKNGFEFAPRKPYDGPYGNSIYIHWQSIVNGIVPFGYRVVE